MTESFKLFNELSQLSFSFTNVGNLLINFHHLQAVHKMVESSEKLKNHIKPYLQEPQYTKLKDPSKLNSIKSNEMMNDLVGSISDLIEDQIQMRTCIPLSPELKEFYGTLMGKKIDNIEEQHEDDYEQDYKESVKQFVNPKKRLIRNIVKI